jgi:hypothetical protein
MTRARFIVAASIAGASIALAAVSAQTPQAPPMQSILAGKKFTPPFKGQADVDFTKPVTKRDKDMVVTTLQVKNTMNAPLLRFTVDETWYDKTGGLVTGGKGVVNRIEPGEVATVKIETPFNPKMSANNYNFSHANGAVKPHRVDKLTGPGDKEPAAKPASATKTTTAKKKK